MWAYLKQHTCPADFTKDELRQCDVSISRWEDAWVQLSKQGITTPGALKDTSDIEAINRFWIVVKRYAKSDKFQPWGGKRNKVQKWSPEYRLAMINAILYHKELDVKAQHNLIKHLCIWESNTLEANKASYTTYIQELDINTPPTIS